MNDRLHPVAGGLFAALPHTPGQHLALVAFAALLRLTERLAVQQGGAEAALSRFPFLGGYLDQVADLGLDGVAFGEAQRRWAEGLAAWEATAPCRLPLVALREAAALDADDVVLLAAIGLTEDDPRFADLFAALQGEPEARAMSAPLAAVLRPGADAGDGRAALHRLEALGLVEPAGADARGWRVQAALWPLVRGEAGASLPGATHAAAGSVPPLDALVLPAPVRAAVASAVAALGAGEADTLVLRGPSRNGRRTLARAMAAALGCGTLSVEGLGADDPRWRLVATAAVLQRAMLVIVAEPGPSETLRLPELPPRRVPMAVVLGDAGALGGPRAERALALRLPMPPREARALLWRAQPGVDGHDEMQLAALSHRRLTSGTIVRAARLAHSAAPSSPLSAAAVRDALRAVERPGLAAMARRIDPGTPPPLALPAQAAEDLRLLAARCRHRERLHGEVGEALAGLGPGVRALFKGPSGTGKTLAARHLAATLGMELYRVDLSAVVNKYIGETEKNLERLFAEAESLDVVLLLDEGDALLTARTGVGNANDRYANLETNFLLQRLESYEGILVVTTNAADRIDGAFQRRLDIVIDFPAPEAAERWALWQMHLPAVHAVDPAWLQTVAQRCALAGGQIRNVALHAALLALEAGAPLAAAQLEAAIEREYRKQGSASPLRARR